MLSIRLKLSDLATRTPGALAMIPIAASLILGTFGLLVFFYGVVGVVALAIDPSAFVVGHRLLYSCALILTGSPLLFFAVWVIVLVARCLAIAPTLIPLLTSSVWRGPGVNLVARTLLPSVPALCLIFLVMLLDLSATGFVLIGVVEISLAIAFINSTQMWIDQTHDSSEIVTTFFRPLQIQLTMAGAVVSRVDRAWSYVGLLAYGVSWVVPLFLVLVVWLGDGQSLGRGAALGMALLTAALFLIQLSCKGAPRGLIGVFTQVSFLPVLAIASYEFLWWSFFAPTTMPFGRFSMTALMLLIWIATRILLSNCRDRLDCEVYGGRSMPSF